MATDIRNSPPTVEDQMFVPVASSFDPSVSGLAGKVGAIAFTSDGTKAWRKFGAGATLWVPLHEISGTKATSGTTLSASDVTGSLACDTLGGFSMTIIGTATTTNPNVYFTFHQTGSAPSGNRQVGVYNHGASIVTYPNSSVLSAFGTGAFKITIEASAADVLSSSGVSQMVRVSAVAANYDLCSEVVVYRTGTPAEITNPGLVITGGTFDAGCQISIRR